jgi:hypothetical protein
MEYLAMENSTVQNSINPWYKKKPILIYVIAYFSVVSFLYMVVFQFENWINVRAGVITFLQFVIFSIPNTLIGVAGVLLFFNKKKCHLFLYCQLNIWNFSDISDI